MGVTSPTEFAQEIAREVEDGSRFVPLVGAGLSFASGVLVGDAMSAYLNQCIVRALDRGGDPWTPRTSKWPSVIETLRDAARWNEWEWIRDTLADVARRDSDDPDVVARQAAVGAMSSWQSALDFLARVVPRREDGLRLMPADDRVKDSFFAHITREHEPNAGNLMLAHLAAPLRMQTVLTTNFDDLIEDAFARLGLPLATFDVHQRTPLPDAERVLERPSVVKLHGARYGLRVDASLDENPTEEDKRTFANYFRGRGAGNLAMKLRCNLLVIGVSGADERIVRLIQHACAEGCIDRVFWACYREGELRTVRQRLCEPDRQTARGGLADGPGRSRQATTTNEAQAKRVVPADRLMLVRHHDLALLLLEIYQRACRSLPPAGADRPAFWDAPADPYGIEDNPPEKEIFDNNVSALSRRIEGRLTRKRRHPGILVVDGGRGISSVAATVYVQLCDDKNKNCIWTSLDEYFNPSDFFDSLTQALAHKVGIPSAVPLSLRWPQRGAEESVLADQVTVYLDRARWPIVVFLNARDGLGTSAGANNEPWRTEACKEFSDVLLAVCREQEKILFVLLVQRQGETHKRSVPELLKALKGQRAARAGWREHVAGCNLNPEPCIPFRAEDVCQEVETWLTKGDPAVQAAKRRFVYALTLFRRSRYFVALCSWALLKAPQQLSYGRDNDDERARIGGNWLTELEGMKAIRRKPGGLSWMHEDLREDLREKCLGHLATDEVGQFEHSWECHQGIADWYMKLFRSLNDPIAALESVYHRLQCVNAAKAYLEKQSRDADRAAHAFETALIEALVTLRLSRDRVLTGGYITVYRNIADVVAGIAGDLASPDSQLPALRMRAAKLQRACYELLRDLARDVGHFDDALENSRRIADWVLPMTAQSPASEDLLSQDVKYRDAVYLTGLRSYEEAENRLLELFADIGLSQIARLHGRWIRKDQSVLPEAISVGDARAAAREWVRTDERPSDAKVRLAIKALRRMMFLQMLIAQACQLAVPDPVAPLGDDALRRFRYAEAIYTMSTEIMRYVDDEAFLQTENAYIRTHYGVTLADLERFSEAHRRLNEATAYLRCSPKNADRLAWAVIDLRRAEVYLDQARLVVRVNTEANGRAVAFLDSAHGSLRQVEHQLQRQRTEIWWWTWMYELELTICERLSQMDLGDRTGCSAGGGPDVALICGLCNDPYEWVTRIVREAQRLIQTDVFRQARLADLVMRIGTARNSRGALDDLIQVVGRPLDRVMKARAEVTGHPLDPQIQTYAEGILRRIRGESTERQGNAAAIRTMDL
jgi:hypothetical protein